MTTTTTSIYPQVTYGVQRFWDSPPFQWQTLQTAACADITACANGYDKNNMASFDAYLAQLLTNGVTEAIYTMARTPYFITSGQNDTSCNYSTVANGACDRPSDLNADGSGTNQTFRMWYAFFASRLNDPTYLTTHAHVRYWEIWNEPDTAAFWGDGSGGAGSYAALVRMTEDMRCMLTGNGVVHNYGANGPVPCAQAGLPATGIDPSALILMPSYHAEPASLTQMQNFLYCTSTSRNCNTGSAGAAAVDVINMHMKPGAVCTPNGAGTNCTAATSVEPAYAGYIANVQSYLQAAELAKPIWDDEASYAPSGFAAPYTDADMAASWIPRFLLVGWSLGVQSHDWYTWDKGLNAYPLAVTAWDTTASWIAGATLSAPCQAVGSSQVFSCTIDKGGTSYEILWDASQSCSGGSCTTNPYAVGAGFKTYADIAGNAPQNVGSCTGCKSDEVPLGVKPLLLAP